ncbi:hypothetical protein T08_4464 [Trichinella sp. T8]|nr:hypothetical protein T08_4464 [Trichinella sp. T8]
MQLHIKAKYKRANEPLPHGGKTQMLTLTPFSH